MSEQWIEVLLGDEEVRPAFEATLRSRVLGAAHYQRWRRWLLPAAAALVAVAGIATAVTLAARRDNGRSVPVEPPTGPTSAPVATSPVSTTSTIASGPTVPSTTGPPPSSTVAPLPPTAASEPSTSTVPATDPPVSFEPPPTSILVAAPRGGAGALDLANGSVFGLAASEPVDSEEAVTRVSAALGGPTADSGWTIPGHESCYPEGTMRSVRWHDLQLVFVRDGEADWLSTWRLGDPVRISVDPIDDPGPFPPSGVSTADGSGVGSSRAAFESADVLVSEPEYIVRPVPRGVLIVHVVDDAVSGLGVGPLDCGAGEGA